MSSLMSEGIHHQVNIKTKRKMSFWKKLLLMILVLASLSYFIWQNEDFQRKYLYPYDYQDTINFYADRYEVDRNLVASVILAESNFVKMLLLSMGLEVLCKSCQKLPVGLLHK